MNFVKALANWSSAVALLASCSASEISQNGPVMVEATRTFYIPEVNEEYAPRDIQLKVELENAYLENSPFGEAPAGSLTGLVFNVDWRTMEPTRAGPHDSVSAATVTLRVVPQDVISSGLDPSHPHYSPHRMFANNPVADNQFGLARRTNLRQGRADGPIDELFTLEDGRFDFMISCYDPGNAPRQFCSMISIRTPEIRSTFVFQTTIVFHRSQLPSWREIKSNVDGFLRPRVSFVPFQNR